MCFSEAHPASTRLVMDNVPTNIRYHPALHRLAVEITQERNTMDPPRLSADDEGAPTDPEELQEVSVGLPGFKRNLVSV